MFLERKVPFLDGKVERDWTVYPQMFKQTLPFLSDSEGWLLDSSLLLKFSKKEDFSFLFQIKFFTILNQIVVSIL